MRSFSDSQLALADASSAFGQGLAAAGITAQRRCAQFTLGQALPLSWPPLTTTRYFMNACHAHGQGPGSRAALPSGRLIATGAAAYQKRARQTYRPTGNLKK